MYQQVASVLTKIKFRLKMTSFTLLILFYKCLDLIACAMAKSINRLTTFCLFQYKKSSSRAICETKARSEVQEEAVFSPVLYVFGAKVELEKEKLMEEGCFKFWAWWKTPSNWWI